MLLRFLTYWALGIGALVRGEWPVAILCFVTPFLGPVGMLVAAIAGIWFIAMGQYIEGAIALGVLVFNLVGNEVVKRKLSI